MANRYGYATRRMEKAGVAATAVITDGGAVDLLEYPTDPPPPTPAT
jgi:hypothetical protein